MIDKVDFPEDLWEVLSPRLSKERKEKLERVVKARTNHVCLVVQDIHDPHNISACIRSAEAFGIQNIHVVDSKNKFKPRSSAARGVVGWLNIHLHEDIPSCVQALRDEGYRLIAGMPRQDSVPLEEIKIEKPLAVIFGNEHAGISSAWLEHIDSFFTIPMHGVVESLNISVSAAITMQFLRSKGQKELKNEEFLLSPVQQNNLLAQWLGGQIRSWKGEYESLKAKSKLS